MFFLYLDESGDLGFDFVNKKPSRHFVITILVVQGHDDNRRLIKGAKKTIRRKLNPSGHRSRIAEELNDRSKGKPEILNFNNYIQSQLEARISPTVPFDINHLDSKSNCGLQEVEMFSYGIFEGYERKRWEWFNVFKEKIAFLTIYLAE